MGYDCTNYLPHGIRVADVHEFLEIIRYFRVAPDAYYYFDGESYSSISGVTATISVDDSHSIHINLHTQIWCSKSDIEKLNWTARQIKKRFGGHWVSDFGKGKYIPLTGPDIKNAEGGCYIAYSNFNRSMQIAELYLASIKFTTSFPPIGHFPSIDAANPLIVSNNLIVPFIVSVIEEFYKSCYIAILKFSESEKKQSIFKNTRLYADELVRISSGESSIEEGIVRAMSFQNIDKITAYFKELDKSLDLASEIRKPYRRRHESLYESISKFFEYRHRLIHQSEIRIDYSSQTLSKDINDIKIVVKRSYILFLRHFKWSPYITEDGREIK
jgi:hypothetical protein